MQLPVKQFYLNNHNPVIVFPVLPSGEAGKIIDVNNRAISSLGFSRTAFRRMRPYDLESKKQPQDYLYYGRKFVTKEYIRYRRIFIDKDGNECDVILTNSPYREKRRLLIFQNIMWTKYLVPLLGITARRVRELELKLKGESVLTGKITVCQYCRKIKTRDNNWVCFETFLEDSWPLVCSHGSCPPCAEKAIKEMRDR
jgi:PAS domain S-box-containing protein